MPPPFETASRDERDVVLITAITAGDRGALAELYDRYYVPLFWIGLRITRSRAEAEDVLHDVFLEVWRTAADYDPARGRVATWLTVRMRSRAIDRRDAPRNARNAGDAALVGLADPRSGDKGPVRFEALLDVLPARQREVIELAYGHGMTSAEIAIAVALPVGTVKSRIAAALARLRLRLSAAPA